MENFKLGEIISHSDVDFARSGRISRFSGDNAVPYAHRRNGAVIVDNRNGFVGRTPYNGVFPAVKAYDIELIAENHIFGNNRQGDFFA